MSPSCQYRSSFDHLAASIARLLISAEASSQAILAAPAGRARLRAVATTRPSLVVAEDPFGTVLKDGTDTGFRTSTRAFPKDLRISGNV